LPLSSPSRPRRPRAARLAPPQAGRRRGWQPGAAAGRLSWGWRAGAMGWAGEGRRRWA